MTLSPHQGQALGVITWIWVHALARVTKRWRFPPFPSSSSLLHNYYCVSIFFTWHGLMCFGGAQYMRDGSCGMCWDERRMDDIPYQATRITGLWLITE
jgi:hypothetical protein